jgi:hypothetical protein
MSNIRQLNASLDGAEIPGGCDRCDAYQTADVDTHGIRRIRVHHGTWCPRWNAMVHPNPLRGA